MDTIRTSNLSGEELIDKFEIKGLVRQSDEDNSSRVPSIARELTKKHKEQIKPPTYRNIRNRIGVFVPNTDVNSGFLEVEFLAELSLQIDKLESINSHQKKILKMYLIDRMLVEEISKQMGIAQNIIEKQLERALRSFFESEYGLALKKKYKINPSIRVDVSFKPKPK